MAAILVAPEFWWFEAASASNLIIKDNVITGCRRPAIEIIAQGGNNKPLPCGAHRNIRITNNTITQSVWPNIRVTSTAELNLDNNHLTPIDPESFTPPLESRWHWGKQQPSPTILEQCELQPSRALQP